MAKRKRATVTKRKPARRLGRRSPKKSRAAVIAKPAGVRRHRSSKKAMPAAIAKSSGKRSRIAKSAAGRRRKIAPGRIAKNGATRGSGRIAKRGGATRSKNRCSKRKRVLLKWKRPARRRKNSAQGAKALYEKFHGKASAKAIDVKTPVHSHAHLAELGKLNYLKVILPDESPLEAVELRPKGVIVAASEDGGQIYFLGGDQALDLAKLGLAAQLPKDHVVIGPVFEIEYTTEKAFDDFRKLNYFHEFGDEGGELPTLLYDVRAKLLYLAGGSYQVLAPGITD